MSDESQHVDDMEKKRVIPLFKWKMTRIMKMPLQFLRMPK